MAPQLLIALVQVCHYRGASNRANTKSLSIRAQLGRWSCVMATAWLGCVSTAFSTAVTSFQLGSTARPGVFFDPASLHAGPGPDLIRVKFDTDVLVTFYSLELRVVGTTACSLALANFSYDSGSHVALWRIDGIGPSTNERFQAVISNVTDAYGTRLAGGAYTNSYTILTCDVSGDGAISAIDVLTVINALNTGAPYDPQLDVNFDGSVSALDTLLIINQVNVSAPPLIAAGAYRAVLMVPPAGPRFDYFAADQSIALTLSGIPSQALVSIQQSDFLPATNWQTVATFFASSTMTNLLLPRDWTKPASFYRAKFQ